MVCLAGAEELRQQQARSNLSWSLKAEHPDLPRRGLSACPMVATSIAGKGSFGEKLLDKLLLPMEGWGMLRTACHV
jgi:hypothetical protein